MTYNKCHLADLYGGQDQCPVPSEPDRKVLSTKRLRHTTAAVAADPTACRADIWWISGPLEF